MAEGGQTALLHHSDPGCITVVSLSATWTWYPQKPHRDNEDREEKDKGLLEGPTAQQGVEAPDRRHTLFHFSGNGRKAGLPPS